MKFLALFLLAFLSSIRSQPDFYAAFDFGMPKRNGMTEDEYSLYTNMLDDTDSEHYFLGENINGTKTNLGLMNFCYNHDPANSNHSVVVVFDSVAPSKRRLDRLLLFDSFSYSIYTTTGMLGVDFSMAPSIRIFNNYYEDNSTIVALALNFQSEGNITKASISYLDSKKEKIKINPISADDRLSLAQVNELDMRISVGNIYYLAFSHKLIEQSVLEAWVGDFLTAGNQSVECTNCRQSFTCPDHSLFVISKERMRKYSCVCNDGYLPYSDQSGNSNCILLAKAEKCDIGCNGACAEIDPLICYENCSSGYKSDYINNNFVRCTAISERPKSAWSYVTLVTMPIFAVGYIVVAVILFWCCRKPNSNSSAIDQIIISSTPKFMKAQGKDNEFGEGSETDNREPKSAADTKKPSMVKVEEENVNAPINMSEPKEKEKAHLGNIPMKEIGICEICNKSNEGLIFMFKCGHVNVCKNCALEAKKCPTCANNILH